ncbi:MAG: hypothetical protein JWN75_1190 [Candidatus Saccharibacteria bacterium]|nr:hypothetical protein [Candidatus Saccharibacteria bacterium]
MSKNKFVVTMSVEVDEPTTKTNMKQFIADAMNKAMSAPRDPGTLIVKNVRVRTVDFD